MVRIWYYVLVYIYIYQSWIAVSYDHIVFPAQQNDGATSPVRLCVPHWRWFSRPFAACFFLVFCLCVLLIHRQFVRPFVYLCVANKQASQKHVYFWENFWHKAFVWFSNYMPFLVVWNSVLAAETQIQSQNQFWWCMLTPQQPNIHASAGSQ